MNKMPSGGHRLMPSCPGRDRIGPFRTLICFCILPLLTLASCVSVQFPILDHGSQGRNAAESLYSKGCQVWDSNHALALQYWEKSMAADPSYKKPVKVLAGAYFAPLIFNEKDKQKRSEYLAKSRIYAARLIDMDKNDPDGYFIMAQAYLFDQQLKEAIPYYTQLLNFNTQDSSVYYKKVVEKNDTLYAIALCYGSLSDYENTLLYLKKFVSECSKSQCFPESVTSARQLIPKIESYLQNLKKVEPAGQKHQATKPQPEPVTPKKPPLRETKLSPIMASSPLPQANSAPDANLALKVAQQRKEIDQMLGANLDKMIFMEASKKDL